MSTNMETQPRRERTVLYAVIGVIVVVLVVIGLFAFSAARSTRDAEEKADQLIAGLEDAGARTPDRDQIVRVLGDDGGAVCEDPNNGLTKAALLAQLANGATGPGARPVIADSRVLQGELLVLQIYCPDQLPDFQEFVDDLKSDDVTEES